MGQSQGSTILSSLVFLTGLVVMVLMCWVLLSGVGWRWDLW